MAVEQEGSRERGVTQSQGLVTLGKFCMNVLPFVSLRLYVLESSLSNEFVYLRHCLNFFLK